MDTKNKYQDQITNRRGRLFLISYILLPDTDLSLIEMDNNYCQYLGFQNRTLMLWTSGLWNEDYRLTWYHDPLTNDVYGYLKEELITVKHIDLESNCKRTFSYASDPMDLMLELPMGNLSSYIETYLNRYQP